MTPFLKWAGGKSWLVNNINVQFPTKFGKYIEPFLGSGAVFFDIKPKSGIISDLNGDLIDSYTAIRSDYKSVEEILKYHHHMHSKDYYYMMRATKPTEKYSKAAWFIYLNRTCWNGLYRVNLKGEFNVPIGTKTSVIMRKDNFKAVSEILGAVDIVKQDFSHSLSLADNGDLIFVDPPYHNSSLSTKFVKYQDTIFGWDEHFRLRSQLIEARLKGAHVIMTHSVTESIEYLYKDIADIKLVSRRDTLAASSDFRGRYMEMVIIFK
ncbi:Dam family site-specific DNA-(adenine-N6)-methyltransferase [Deinococcus sp. AJ005]|uniref:DNA adenine methylase n=1 Tax=Deinococcus sp. AJ005 TaxID=2652443 RepID=UPI0018656E41|nr:Dam family site-specific DNA-(adenine-N6)-methyltransferase [Deinococcus sp. AJ005]